ncbi:MAG TPA: DUF4238 domain-containing protein [Stellaceae bacterium]|nr:DUF4238 domain-containing protein [Stellaceae bacterium]
MSEPHRHHFIPVFYLRQWHGPDDKLVEYTIKHRKLIAKPVSADSTGFKRDLYEFPELPSPLSQFLETQFFNYADRTASKALAMLLDGAPKHLWSSEILSAWARFLVGVHTRHFDTIPEIRDAAKTLWAASGEQSQRFYEEIRQPDDPPTFDEWIAIHDPLIPHKAAINMMVAAMDNPDVGKRIIEMHWEVIEIAATPRRFLASDRPLGMYLIKEPKGSITLPISPTKLFVAVNNRNYLSDFRRQKHRQIVDQINADHIARARHFVWAQGQSHSQGEFIRRHMSTKMEKPPFFPSLANYQSSTSS